MGHIVYSVQRVLLVTELENVRQNSGMEIAIRSENRKRGFFVSSTPYFISNTAKVKTSYLLRRLSSNIVVHVFLPV